MTILKNEPIFPFRIYAFLPGLGLHLRICTWLIFHVFSIYQRLAEKKPTTTYRVRYNFKESKIPFVGFATQ